MTIRRKLLINTLIIIIALFTITFSLLGFSYYQITKKNKIEELTSLSMAKASEISLWFQEAINEFSLMASLPSFRTLDIREISPIINSVSSHNAKLNNIGVSTIDGKSLLDNTNLKYIDHQTFNILTNSDQPYIIQAPSANYPYFIICCPIFNYTDDKIGFIYGTIANNDILDILNEVKIPSSIMWLIDENYQIISHNPTYFADRYLTSTQLAFAINNDQVSLKDQQGQHIFFQHYPIDNSNGLSICTLIPQAIILKDIYLLLGILIILFCATIICLYLIISNTTNKITKPIDILIQKMQKRETNNREQGFKELNQLSLHYNQLLATIDEQIKAIYQTQNDLREAELKSLQAQINPHFLYNSLDTIKWMAYDHGIDEIYDILANMSQFFRIALSSGQNIITLEKELEHVTSYLKVQKIRYDEILNYQINCQPSVKKLPCLKLIIQPLAENALYHGIKPAQKACTIKINAFYNHQQDLVLQIKDDGIGIAKEQLATITQNLANHTKSNHYGLYNINERLNHYYQDGYSLKIHSRSKHGTTITITIKHEAIFKGDHHGKDHHM
ncbi:MAG: sensor histidine kinase [Erysipelotrichaceae bacterium]|nr:sensor histidine kinase [Erysipelotrichaceae bacterium]MDY5251235.1 sensor histidine kinase [Erysipelotrichaceae bacterium]